ncbi:hypothetical protein ONS95_005844 [Cadophora gregata]|uniref:uncharacterized protein n=1 Tax=Cadophora gregata TaxID=51156 RepID=UPI0026DB4FE2|nr:uncharacterized protein ONS95_005844 [Cadophora gregata]KAK0102220.1 hypothetical protein ONS95_005844 [Cadophora gregata]KAK0103848.1 hypothetical protein ONS96_004957 [Cadophora gregata f. sp. sojae]
MRLSYAFVFAVSSTLVASQSASSLVAQLPSCAISCLASASTTNGCGISDYACQCGAKKADITKTATPCVLSACSQDDALKTNSLTGQICKAASSVQTSATNGGSYASYFPSTSKSSATSVPSVSYPANPPPASTPAASAPASNPPATYPPASNPPAATVSSAPSATTSGPIQATGAASRVNGGVFAAAAVVLAAFAL